MKTSETLAHIAPAFLAAQKSIAGVVKGENNSFFKSRYADVNSVIQAIKDESHANGISYIQFPISTEHGVGVCTRLLHESGEWMEEDYTLPLAKQDPQAGGSCITYSRRYALISIYGLPQFDDDSELAMARVDTTDIATSIKDCKTIDDLLSLYNTLSPELANQHQADLMKRKEELENGSKD